MALKRINKVSTCSVCWLLVCTAPSACFVTGLTATFSRNWLTSGVIHLPHVVLVLQERTCSSGKQQLWDPWVFLTPQYDPMWRPLRIRVNRLTQEASSSSPSPSPPITLSSLPRLVLLPRSTTPTSTPTVPFVWISWEINGRLRWLYQRVIHDLTVLP